MAGVAFPGIRQQLMLIAALRWRLFRNALRKTSEWLDLLSFLFTGILSSVFVVGVGVGLGIGAHFLVVQERFEFLLLPMLAVFFFWEFVPLLLASSATGFDFRNLLRFPLRFPTFFLLNLAYALFDPGAVGSLVWLGCIGTGIVLARPDLLPATLWVTVVFAAVNLLLSRMLFSWFERLLARRRTREALAALFILSLLSFQLFSALGTRSEKRWRPLVVAAMPVLRILPPGLAGNALAAAARGEPGAAALSSLMLAAYGVGFGLLLNRRLRAQYLGEDLGESPAVIPAASVSSSSSAPSASSFLPGPVGAVVEKEFRYLVRNSVAGLNLAVPLILIVFLSLSSGSARHRTSLFTRSPDLAFPAAISYMFLIIAPLLHNSFAFDGRGVQLLFLAPARFREVLLGKNLVFALVAAVETLAVWLLVSFLFRPPGTLMVMTTLSGLVFAVLVNFLVGNWLSLAFPRRFEFGQFRRRASGTSILLGFAVQFALFGLVSVVYLLARWRGVLWMVPVAFLALSALTLPVYRAALDSSDRLALEKRDVLASQLCR